MVEGTVGAAGALLSRALIVFPGAALELCASVAALVCTWLMLVAARLSSSHATQPPLALRSALRRRPRCWSWVPARQPLS